MNNPEKYLDSFFYQIVDTTQLMAKSSVLVTTQNQNDRNPAIVILTMMTNDILHNYKRFSSLS